MVGYVTSESRDQRVNALSWSLLIFTMKGKIDQKTTLGGVLKHQGTEKILAKYQVPCLACPYAQMEMDKLSLGEICQRYGIDQKELIRELNEHIKEQD